MRVADELRDVRYLLVGDVSNAAPPDGGLVVRRRERGQGRVPRRVQGGVGELRQGRVEEVVSWGESLDLFERGIASPDDCHCGLGQGPVSEHGEVARGAERLECLQYERQSPVGGGHECSSSEERTQLTQPRRF